MRIAFAAAAALLLAASAAAQTAPQGRLGARTTSPAEMLSQIEQDDLAEALAAAAAHPLGTRDNPVRVGGPEGERAYIARLRCPGGGAPQVGPRREAGVGALGTVVAAYALDCGATRFELVMDMYHEEHRESRAPAGLGILP
jgi:hypothetical protein